MAQGHAGGGGEERSFLEPMATPARSRPPPPAAAAPRTAAGGAARPAGDAAAAGAQDSAADEGVAAGFPQREAVLLVLDGQLQALPWESLHSLQHQRCALNPGDSYPRRVQQQL